MKYIVLFSLFLLVVGCGNEDSKGEVGRYTLQEIGGTFTIIDTKTGRIYRYWKGWHQLQELDLNTEYEKLPIESKYKGNE